MKLALLIIDMQKGLLQDHADPAQIHKACVHINHVASLLRSKNQPVIHVQDVEGSADLNDESLAIINEIQVEPGDLNIKKEASNSFWNTELEQLLNKHEVGLVIVAGFAAEHCVLFTYNGARERGFKTVILHNGIVAEQRETIGAMYRDRNLVSYPAVEFMVGEK
ncbi:isochorismatase [Paenibacillus swuensis]|uniref:Isochorismatase n=1 Tax=Paenibacillus swuensis TaxID=1178515 RepID=A0A172TG00_9BACL|nr:isochorismatase family cysteine hydrolase [Paenibacillus swuensis]ANE45807.1 isochorismatase [Paenibacillus swuensis]